MTERERQINQDLRALDDAYRLSRMAREDYRKRRRQLLGSFSDVACITARHTLRDVAMTSMYAQSPADYARRRASQRARASTEHAAWRHLALFLGTVIVAGALLYWFWLRHV